MKYTGTERGHQIWLPEQKVVIKYCYRNKTWSSNMVTGTFFLWLN
jgi:hypothetical protein